MIVALAKYINLDLRPRIKSLIGGNDVLLWEDFLGKERAQRQESFGIMPILGEEYLLALIFPTTMVTLYLLGFSYRDVPDVINEKGIHIYSLAFLLVIINIIALVLTVLLKKGTGRT